MLGGLLHLVASSSRAPMSLTIGSPLQDHMRLPCEEEQLCRSCCKNRSLATGCVRFSQRMHSSNPCQIFQSLSTSVPHEGSAQDFEPILQHGSFRIHTFLSVLECAGNSSQDRWATTHVHDIIAYVKQVGRPLLQHAQYFKTPHCGTLHDQNPNMPISSYTNSTGKRLELEVSIELEFVYSIKY